MNSVLIKLDGVSAGYDGTIVLRHADLTVNDRDFARVIGPNGGGKTTLVKLLLGQISPATGTVKTLGKARTHRLSSASRLNGQGFPDNGQGGGLIRLTIDQRDIWTLRQERPPESG